MTQPRCQVCQATGNGVQFPMTGIKTSGFTFGEICVRCDIGDLDITCGCSRYEPYEACPTHTVQFRQLRQQKART